MAQEDAGNGRGDGAGSGVPVPGPLSPQMWAVPPSEHTAVLASRKPPNPEAWGLLRTPRDGGAMSPVCSPAPLPENGRTLRGSENGQAPRRAHS